MTTSKSKRPAAALAAVAAAATLAAVASTGAPGEVAAESSTMTAAAAAKLVKRITVIKEAGAERTQVTAIAPNEVLAFKDYGTHVVVVTIDGHKFSSADA